MGSQGKLSRSLNLRETPGRHILSASSLKPQELDREPGLRPGLGRRNDHGPARPGGVLRLFGRICATDAPGSEHSGGPKGRFASPGGEYQLIPHRQA